MEILVLLGSFTVLCALAVPVAYALGLAALIAALYVDIPLEAVMLKISDGTDDFALLAIPFFVLAGAIMAEGGMAMRLVNLAADEAHEHRGDRKSTRLNSSHRCISYAVFCLKKKKQHRERPNLRIPVTGVP